MMSTEIILVLGFVVFGLLLAFFAPGHARSFWIDLAQTFQVNGQKDNFAYPNILLAKSASLADTYSEIYKAPAETVTVDCDLTEHGLWLQQASTNTPIELLLIPKDRIRLVRQKHGAYYFSIRALQEIQIHISGQFGRVLAEHLNPSNS